MKIQERKTYLLNCKGEKNEENQTKQQKSSE